jgi:hypothetical protein
VAISYLVGVATNITTVYEFLDRICKKLMSIMFYSVCHFVYHFHYKFPGVK